jgi:hypothetical protein
MNEIDEILSNIDKDDEYDLIRESDDLKERDNAGGTAEPAGTIQEDRAHADEASGSEISVSGLFEDKSQAEKQETSPLPERGGFVLRGTKTWNTREPYTIKIADGTLQRDLSDLHRSFFFVDEPLDTDSIQKIIKQEIVKYLRKPNENIMERYSDFINKLVIVNIQHITNDFELNEDTEKLFVYHAGPLTIYKILKEGFVKKKYGFCYKYMPGNKAVRYFPAEFIKEIILKWFTENIHVLDLPFDSIQKYEDIRNLVQRKYQNDLRVFNMRLDQLNVKIGANKTISRTKLFQLKGAVWFGLQNIEIYKRFLGSAIFS